MKIITEGKLPGEEVFRASCPHCKTLFEFQRKESRSSQDQRDGDVMIARCPLTGCGRDVYVSPSRTRRRPSASYWDR